MRGIITDEGFFEGHRIFDCYPNKRLWMLPEWMRDIRGEVDFFFYIDTKFPSLAMDCEPPKMRRIR